jgi:diguanylate cyclase (GGDEF)-like protein/PAS domain S-box-containing protein
MITHVTDSAVCLAVLVLAAIAIPVWVRRSVGGSRSSYLALECGLALLILVEVLRLTALFVPEWSDRLSRMGVRLPLHAGGYLLALLGFLSLVRDFYRVHVGEQRIAEREHCRADAAAAEEVRVRHQRDLVNGILETGELAIIGLSLPDGRLTMFNRGAELITGYARAEVLGRPYEEVFTPPEDRARIRQAILDGWNGRVPAIGQRLHTILTKSGERRQVAWTYSGTVDETGHAGHLISFGTDVTTERQMQARLEQAKAELEQANTDLARLAATDSLTGLVNRRQANILFAHEIAASRRCRAPVGVVMVDIDHFKNVNDTYGHKVGDEVLVHVAERLKGRLRASDIIARYGGEEFLVILPNTPLAGAVTVAETLRRSFEDRPMELEGGLLRLTLSFGVAVMKPDQDLSADGLIRLADQALYAAKARGRNRVVPCEELTVPASATTPNAN